MNARIRYLKIIFVLMVMLTVAVVGSVLANPTSELPLVTAGQASYAGGDTAFILGYEFQPGQELVIEITNPKGNASSGTVVVDTIGEFVYQYRVGQASGLYQVKAIDNATITKGKDKSAGVALASTAFMGNVVTDLEMVGMPDVGLYRPAPPPRSGPRDGLVDAIAGRCLVGTVDINAVGQTSDIRGFMFDLVVDLQSEQQGPTPTLMDFIDKLETVSTADTPDSDTGSAPAPEGKYYTTAGNGDIVGPVQLTSLDGTLFDVVGPITPGPAAGEMVYQVTVSLDNPTAFTSARFEYCARINPNAGDADNGTDGFVTSSPETGGTETSPINVIRVDVDDTPPICVLEGIAPGPPTTLTVFIEDSDSGVESVEVLTLRNATVEIPLNSGDLFLEGQTKIFSPPETSAFYVQGVKIDESQSAQLALRVTDAAGNFTDCDPVHTVAIREDGKPVSETYADIPHAEGIVTIDNGNPGLTNLDIVVNGQKFDVSGMGDSETRSVDVSSAMLAGNNNVVTVTTYGQPGTSATILIWDGNG